MALKGPGPGTFYSTLIPAVNFLYTVGPLMRGFPKWTVNFLEMVISNVTISDIFLSVLKTSNGACRF